MKIGENKIKIYTCHERGRDRYRGRAYIQGKQISLLICSCKSRNEAITKSRKIMREVTSELNRIKKHYGLTVDVTRNGFVIVPSYNKSPITNHESPQS